MTKRREAKLIDAVWDGDPKKVAKLLGEGVPATARGSAGSALWAAVSTRRTEIVELLLQHGADANEREKDQAVIHRAVMEDPTLPAASRLVRTLVAHGAETESRSYEGETPLLAAVREAARRRPTDGGEGPRKRPGLLAALSAEGANVSGLDPEADVAGLDIGSGGVIVAGGVTVLGMTGGGGEPPVDRLSVVDALIELGADLGSRDAAGATATMIAALEGDQELVEQLVERGADREGVDAVRLLEAASEGRDGEVDGLLAAGVEPSRRFPRRGTPLSEAAQNGHLRVVERLLEAGADPDLADSDAPDGDFNPLFNATYSGHLEIMERLLAAGADPFAPGPAGRRLFDYAVIGREEGHKKDKPWDAIVARIREATAGGAPTVGLEPLATPPPVAAELAEVDPGLAALSWSRARLGEIEILESSRLDGAPESWDGLREAASNQGWAAILAAWSLEDVQPDATAAREAVEAASADAGRRWLDQAAARTAADAEADRYDDEDDWEEDPAAQLAELPVRPGSTDLRCRHESPHLVLVQSAPESVAALYGFAQEELSPTEIAAVFAAWREASGAELAAFDRATADLVLPRRLEDEDEIRARAFEIFEVAPDLDDAESVLGMAASRQWTLWWD